MVQVLDKSFKVVLGDLKPVQGIKIVHVDTEEAFWAIAKAHKKETKGLVFVQYTSMARTWKILVRDTLFIWIEKLQRRAF
ncbi:hypothetical protein [Thermococcus barophilus]|uniref:Uncharacterized protein n=1 Tax=Thermococcus barophilus TaxID=55802 RepID=A0A0S1XEJ0_THEBA|nr:hypothetical protein [Thermococcus barophilus]ALM76229.1 hypothetical protein TBCH5v1_2334 [Thermococcus barophilus]